MKPKQSLVPGTRRKLEVEASYMGQQIRYDDSPSASFIMFTEYMSEYPTASILVLVRKHCAPTSRLGARRAHIQVCLEAFERGAMQTVTSVLHDGSRIYRQAVVTVPMAVSLAV